MKERFKNLGVLATAKDYSWLTDKFITELPNPDIILKRLGAGVELFNELKYDPHVASCVQSRKSGILSMDWEINRGGIKTTQVQFIYDIFKKLDVRRIISDILEAPLFGFQIMEIYWRTENDKIVPKDIIAKPHEWFYVDSNNFWRFRRKSKKDGVLLPARKFLTVTHNASYTDPYGESILSRCYWSVFFKKDTIKFWSTFTEKYGMPYLWGQTDIGSTIDNKDDLLRSLDEMRQDGILITEGEVNKVSILDASRSSSPDLYQKFIHFHNAEISKAILSQTLTTEQGDTGSYAMSQTHLMVRQDVVDSDKKLVEMWMNKLIRWILEYNFEEEIESPVFELYAEEDVDMTLADRDSKLSPMIKFTKEYFKRSYGFSDDEFDIIEASSPTFSQNEFTTETKINNTSSNDLNVLGENMITPVLELINQGKNYDEIYDNLTKLLPEIDTKEIEDIIGKGILISSVGGMQ